MTFSIPTKRELILMTVAVLVTVVYTLFRQAGYVLDPLGAIVEQNSKDTTIVVPATGSYAFVRVVDGDTLVVKDDAGTQHKVRLIGIDTPEVVDPRRPVECFGKQASAYMKKLLQGTTKLELQSDSTQGDLDKYGRWLRYVYLPDGRMANLIMLSEGYAYEYTYKVPYQEQYVFKTAQQKAQEEKKGLWADNACGPKAK